VDQRRNPFLPSIVRMTMCAFCQQPQIISLEEACVGHPRSTGPGYRRSRVPLPGRQHRRRHVGRFITWRICGTKEEQWRKARRAGDQPAYHANAAIFREPAHHATVRSSRSVSRLASGGGLRSSGPRRSAIGWRMCERSPLPWFVCSLKNVTMLPGYPCGGSSVVGG
jgi:hypothetical protein